MRPPLSTEHEPDLPDRQELDWETAAYYEAWEAGRRAYEAVQQANDELYARLMEED
jgi:hypothetical protein